MLSYNFENMYTPSTFVDKDCLLRPHLVLILGSYNLQVTIIKCLVNNNCCNLNLNWFDQPLYDEKLLIFLIIFVKIII